MRFRLRYLQHDLELPEGTFAIGRNATCQLSLDDPLVSRRHAILTVTKTDVHAEDLESRNGVVINGQRIKAKVRVLPGDKIVIGSQELTVLSVEGTLAPPGALTTGAMPRVTVSGLAAVTDDDASITKIGHVAASGEEQSIVRRLEGFTVLGSVAEKALAMGRTEEAERVLHASLQEVLDTARKGKAVPPMIAEQATRFAAKLATATGRGAWVDYVIDVYAAARRPAPASVVDELYGAFRRVSGVDVTKVRAYVEDLRSLLPSFGPADRFLFQRIEGLERLASLRG